MKSAWNIERTQISRIILSSKNDVFFPFSSLFVGLVPTELKRLKETDTLLSLNSSQDG